MSAADVPVFTVVAWDVLAPRTVQRWIDEARAAGVNSDKVDRATKHLVAILEWQALNPEKVKLPD